MSGAQALEGKDFLAHTVLYCVTGLSLLLFSFLIIDWYDLHKNRSKPALKDWECFLENGVKFECRHRLGIYWHLPPEYAKYEMDLWYSSSGEPQHPD